MSEQTAVKDLFYTDQEDEILVGTRGLRQRLIQLLTTGEKEGQVVVPGKSADKILLDQLLNGVDKDIHTRAKLRIATKANENLSDTRALLAKALLSHRNLDRNPAPAEARHLDDSFIPTDVVPGETSQGVTTFNLDEFINR